MKKKFFQDISASTLQVLFNQVLGLLVFILTSRYLTKSEYGELNWSLAMLTFVITILSLRLEQIVVQKVAAGDNPSMMLTLFTGHTVFFGVVFYGLLFLLTLLFPSFFIQHNLLLILAVSQLLSFFASPFKHLANGKELFKLLAIMSSVSNLVKSILLLLLLMFFEFTVQQVIIVFIIASLTELFVSMYIVQYRLKVSISNQWKLSDYYALLNESIPQIGSVFLNACIARFDWILLGFFTTTIITAEYSFAYKMFELCPLPVLILGPVLLSRFSRYFSSHNEDALLEKKKELGFYIRYAMIAATFIPLVLNLAWTPMIDMLTNNKYGAVNKNTFLLLSFCIPFQYMINLFWTIHFAQNRLKLIFRITAVTSIVIITGDLLMIPVFNAKGAAIVYLLATIVEYIIYLRSSIMIKMKDSWESLLICLGIALVSGFFAEYMSNHLFLKLILASGIYISLVVITGQVKRNDRQTLKHWLNNK